MTTLQSNLVEDLSQRGRASLDAAHLAALHGLVLRGPDLEACRSAAVDRQHPLRPGLHLAVPVFVLASRTAASCMRIVAMIVMAAIADPTSTAAVVGLLIYAIAAGGFTTNLRECLF